MSSMKPENKSPVLGHVTKIDDKDIIRVKIASQATLKKRKRKCVI